MSVLAASAVSLLRRARRWLFSRIRSIRDGHGGATLAQFAQLPVQKLAVRIVNRRCRWFHWAWPHGRGVNSSCDCDLQLLVLPGEGRFSTRNESRVVIALPGATVPAGIVEQSDLVIHSTDRVNTPEELFRELQRGLAKVA